MNLKDMASKLTLHFIGFTKRPDGIEDKVYLKVKIAFWQNRGQYEWEESAIKLVLEQEAEKEKP